MTTRFLIKALPLILLFGVHAAARAQGTSPAGTAPDSAKITLIRELIAVSKVTETTRRALRLGLDAQKVAQPQIPEVFWEEFIARAERDIDRFIEMVIPVYDRHFTAGELRELIAFHRTPFGQRMVEKLPLVMEESSRVGQEWGMKLGMEVGQDLVARGIIK